MNNAPQQKSAFWQLYENIEKTFFNSLSKKLSSFLLLFCVDLGYLGVYFYQQNTIQQLLHSGNASPELLARIGASLTEVIAAIRAGTLSPAPAADTARRFAHDQPETQRAAALSA